MSVTVSSKYQVVIPEPDRPRIYREYPLRGSGFLPINFILEASSTPTRSEVAS